MLERALTHRSRAHEQTSSEAAHDYGNERLEFLGDAVLDLVVRELLMRSRPDHDEGRLSRARAAMVNTRALAERSRQLGLDGCLRLGRGEARSAGRHKTSILANVFEAVLGALYLDGGLAPVERLVEREFGAALADFGSLSIDPKTQLQELLQGRRQPVPEYRTTAELGPDHAREFLVEVHVEGARVGEGRGSSKREAEQQAASRALEVLGE